MSVVETIEPGGISKWYWQTLWQQRELVYFMTWRDLIVRYKQTLLGVAWVWLKPLVTMLIFASLFGALAKLDSRGLPYGLVVLVAMIAWNLFSQIVTDGGNCLVSNSGMITKIYFPRLVLPLVSLLVSTVDFFGACLFVIVMFLWYQIVPSLNLIFLPLFFTILILQASGLALIFASLSVKYRDFRIVVPYVLQVGLYVSPVAYISATIPEKYQFLYFLNPMASVIEGFRWCFFGNAFAPNWGNIAYSTLFSLTILFIGIRIFRAAESKFADVI
jgi:lipopolysaccharide transport system permease protein